eukprot:gene15042-8696_t
MLVAAPPDARARLRAKQTEHAGAWLTAVPAPSLGLWLEPALFTTAMRLWLGIPVSDDADQVCPACGAAVADLGAHALACMSSGSATLRHHALRDLLWFKCRTAGLRPEVEKEGLLPHTLYRPADVWLPRWPGGGIALDLAVVSPLQRRFMAQAGMVSRAAAEAYCDWKAERFDCAAECAKRGINFCPLVVETFGGWSREGAATLRAIAGAVAQRTGVATGVAVEQLHQSLSVTPWRSNARAALDRTADLRAAGGSAFDARVVL